MKNKITALLLSLVLCLGLIVPALAVKPGLVPEVEEQVGSDGLPVFVPKEEEKEEEKKDPPPPPPQSPSVDYDYGNDDTPSSSSSSSAVRDASGSTRGGSWSSDKPRAEKGEIVTITANPESGYEVKSVTVRDASGKEVTVTSLGGNKYSFVMPNGTATVSVEFVRVQTGTGDKPEVTEVSFRDVPAGAYYADAVAWAVKNGVTMGTGDGSTFSPNAGCTRAQFVTFLYRAAGSPRIVGAVNKFSDVSAAAHASYYDAILWAVGQGITMGTGDGSTFSPDAVVTRAQSVTFMYRYAQKAGIAAATGVPSFDDVSNTGALRPYYDAIGWAVANGITNGNSTTANTFGPMDDCVRANMITFLYRLFTDARA